MEINIFPHLSGALSMKRYFTGLSAALLQKHTVNVYSPPAGFENIGFRKKYPEYLKLAGSVKHGHNLILSERFSFLLLKLKRDKTIVICHDLVTLLNPATSWLHKQWYKILLRIMARAKSIICISESTRKDLLHFCPYIPGGKVKVVLNGIEPFWFDDQPVQLERSNIDKLADKKFFLMVGTDAWNKNFNAVISALQTFQQPDFHLIKIGGLSATHQAELEQAGLQNRVIHIPNVSDHELKWLYKNAEALIFPSLHEGFGWPVLEAMASGCPVIASNTSSVPEVGGYVPLYIDPKKPESIAQAMTRILSDSALKSELIASGKKRAEAFSWQLTADKIANAFTD